MVIERIGSYDNNQIILLILHKDQQNWSCDIFTWYNRCGDFFFSKKKWKKETFFIDFHTYTHTTTIPNSSSSSTKQNSKVIFVCLLFSPDFQYFFFTENFFIFCFKFIQIFWSLTLCCFCCFFLFHTKNICSSPNIIHIIDKMQLTTTTTMMMIYFKPWKFLLHERNQNIRFFFASFQFPTTTTTTDWFWNFFFLSWFVCIFFLFLVFCSAITKSLTPNRIYYDNDDFSHFGRITIVIFVFINVVVVVATCWNIVSTQTHIHTHTHIMTIMNHRWMNEN